MKPQVTLYTRTGCCLCDHAKQVIEDAVDLAVRQAGVLVQFDDGGLSVGAQLGSGGTQRVGSL